MKEVESFNLIKRAIDLGVQRGIFGSIEETNAVHDALLTIKKVVEPKQESAEATKEATIQK
jgi:hypothetical protein